MEEVVFCEQGMKAGSAWTQSVSAMHEWESPDYEPSLPVSEKSNPLTRDIDRASANHIVRMLHKCDAQMFLEDLGSTYQRLWSDTVMKTMMEVAKRVELILKDPQEGLIVLSGCGTSGRLAFLVASTFNRALRQLKQSNLYTYIIAGGDRALFSSQEAPEDDPKAGASGLTKVCEGKRHVLFIGISCGLSAPFVAGQLDLCLQQPEIFTPVLVGFNPTHQARNEAMAGCNFTFRNVVQRMQELSKTQKAFLINPSVGPEAISGSSRMKGGSATKMILETILMAAHGAAFTNTPIANGSIQQHLREYAKTLDITYSRAEEISGLVSAAGQSLLCSRHVYYLGWGSLATLGLIDASECDPTFGAAFEDIRGFVSGGYRELNNSQGPLIALGPEFCIAHEDFLCGVLPFLNDEDVVILVYTHCDDVDEVAGVTRRVRDKTNNIHAVYHQLDGDSASAVQEDIDKLCKSALRFTWPSSASESSLHMWELSTKLVLNAVSTGAHVLKGKIYQNHMIDVQVTNSKLYHRATRMLQKLSGHPEQQCEEVLLKVLYEVEELTVDITSSDVTAHALAGKNRTKVVPLALVCLLTGCSLVEGKEHLKQQPVVREAVEACLMMFAEQQMRAGNV